ncbi:MAG: class I SAM-dependent methyltransferase [Patescibacteria group bacterium]|nr:methyltransferase domain-containing protein [Patescibacteria group bacterium]MDE1971042.1 class I SAM-dependent methyltransferase [Patescibacteria group bacterium]
MDVYDNPKYYDIAFSFRDIAKEVDFLEQIIKNESLIPVKTVLEIASGNSPHMSELCRRGYDYVGLEQNEEMIEYSTKTIEDLGLKAEIIRGDLRNFRTNKQADCALLFLGSFYVTDDHELQSHMDSVAHSVRGGGLYFLDGAVLFFPEDFGIQTWEMERDGVKVITTYDPKWIDERNGLSDARIILEIEENGEKKVIEHTETRKLYRINDFIAKAEATSKWEHVSDFSDFDAAKKPYPGGRNITVLRRRI